PRHSPCDQLKAAVSLPRRIVIDAPVGHDRRAPGHDHPIADPHRAAEPDRGLVRGTRGDAPPVLAHDVAGSSHIVNGPSFTSSTSISAPKTPRATFRPRASSAAANASTSSAASSGSAAYTNEGRRPLRVSAYSVNWETTRASPFTSAIARFLF